MRQPNSVRAWVKPLKSGVQYYAKVEGHERIMGAANHPEEAHDLICDYVYDRVPDDFDWQIEWRGAAHA